MRKQKSNKYVNKYNLLNKHLVNNRFDSKEEILAGFYAIDFSKSERSVIVISTGFDPI